MGKRAGEMTDLLMRRKVFEMIGHFKSFNCLLKTQVVCIRIFGWFGGFGGFGSRLVGLTPLVAR